MKNILLSVLVIAVVVGGGMYLIKSQNSDQNDVLSEANEAKGLSGLKSYGTKVVMGNCTYTQGYWKNHPEAWPIDALNNMQPAVSDGRPTGSTTGTWQTWMSVFGASPQGDARVILMHQLYAAQLNIAHGADASTISKTIEEAKTLLANNLTVVNPTSDIGQQMVALAATLDVYNNGTTGPGHCAQ